MAYLLAITFGLLTGWINQKVDDALLTALCVLAFTMFLGVWKPERPWRWGLLVWVGVPLVLAYYQFVVKWPHDYINDIRESRLPDSAPGKLLRIA